MRHSGSAAAVPDQGADRPRAGAASVHGAIYSLLMLRDGFMAGSANIERLDARAEGFSHPAPEPRGAD